MTKSKQQDKDALDMLKLNRLMREIIANAPDDTLVELKELHDGIGTSDNPQGTNNLILADFGEVFAEAMLEEMRPELNLYKKVCNALTYANEANPDNITEEEVDKACYTLRRGLGLE